jgi:hypothetical protein
MGWFDKVISSVKGNSAGQAFSAPLAPEKAFFAIGDVHGQFHALDSLLKKIEETEHVDPVICVGDYIDRGEYSAHVLTWMKHLTELYPDFFVCLLGNHERLKDDLASMGISDPQMSLYMFLKPREFGAMGFSGVEGRHYSLFENFGRDLGNATSLQALVMALAYKLVVTGRVTHADIPDDPVLESERRQIFFGSAIDLPTFFVQQNSRNRFLQQILASTQRTRSSKRYPGYLRVYNTEYRHALIAFLQKEAAALIESQRHGHTLEDLKLRLDFPRECAASGKLTQQILERLNARDPMAVPAGQFNQVAEDHYREGLKKTHLAESVEYLERDLQRLDQAACLGDISIPKALDYNLNGQSALTFLKNIKRDLLADALDVDTLQRLINLLIFTIHRDQLRAERTLHPPLEHHEPSTPVHRAG